MINNVVLVGRLTRDLDLRYTTSNKAAVNFTLAVNRNFKNEKGEFPADFIGDFCLALAWSLRNNHNYGAKRIERTIRELFEVVSDAKMKEVGQMLFDMSEIKEQLLVETGLDIEPVIVEEVNKHITRIKEFKENE